MSDEKNGLDVFVDGVFNTLVLLIGIAVFYYNSFVIEPFEVFTSWGRILVHVPALFLGLIMILYFVYNVISVSSWSNLWITSVDSYESYEEQFEEETRKVKDREKGGGDD